MSNERICCGDIVVREMGDRYIVIQTEPGKFALICDKSFNRWKDNSIPFREDFCGPYITLSDIKWWSSMFKPDKIIKRKDYLIIENKDMPKEPAEKTCCIDTLKKQVMEASGRIVEDLATISEVELQRVVSLSLHTADLENGKPSELIEQIARDIMLFLEEKDLVEVFENEQY